MFNLILTEKLQGQYKEYFWLLGPDSFEYYKKVNVK